MALNAETEKRWWLWMPKLRSDDGSNRRNWECGFERQNKNANLNAKWKRNLMALNVKLKMQGNNEGNICPSVACRYNSQSIGNFWKRLHESQKMLCWRVGTVKSTANMVSQSIWLNHETWWCASTSQTPLTQNAPLEESIVISNEWSNEELQENDSSG